MPLPFSWLPWAKQPSAPFAICPLPSATLWPLLPKLPTGFGSRLASFRLCVCRHCLALRFWKASCTCAGLMRSQSLRQEDGFATASPARAETEGNGTDSATPLLRKSPFVLPLGMLPRPFLGFDVSVRADFSFFPS